VVTTIRTAGEIQVAELSGRIDITSTPEFRGQLDRLLAQGCRRLILDFSGVEYISSAGLHEIFSVAKQLDQSLVVCGLSPEVLHIFHIAGYLTRYPVAGSVQQAFQKLSEGQQS
jgi:anti-anti-sigma factor